MALIRLCVTHAYFLDLLSTESTRKCCCLATRGTNLHGSLITETETESQISPQLGGETGKKLSY